METKRQINCTGIRVKFLGATNSKGSRLKFTQTNNNNSFIIGVDYRVYPLEQIEIILNKLDLEGFNMVIDNTQNDYYLFNIINSKNEIPNYIEQIKKLTKN